MEHNPSADEGLVEDEAKRLHGKPRCWQWIGDSARQAYRIKARIALAAARSHGGM